MAGKRSFSDAFDEFEDVSQITHTSPKAKIHCVISEIPEEMKDGAGSSYFDGKLSGDQKSIRVYGYDPDVKRRLFSAQTQQNRTVLLSACSVKQARHGNTLEVFVNKHTTIETSDKNFTIPESPSTSAAEEPVTLAQVQELPKHTRVTVEVKVQMVSEPKHIPSKNLTVQELSVADSSGALRLSIWQDEIGQMEQDKSYRIEGATIREYNGHRFLSTSPKKSNIIPIEDIGPLDETLAVQLGESSKPLNNVKDVRVKGIEKFDTYPICFKSMCQGKVKLDEDDNEMGECIRCGTIQAISEEQTGVTATLCLQPQSGHVIKLRAFDHILKCITEVSGPVTPKSLLKARPFTVQHEDGIIKSIRHS